MNWKDYTTIGLFFGAILGIIIVPFFVTGFGWIIFIGLVVVVLVMLFHALADLGSSSPSHRHG